MASTDFHGWVIHPHPIPLPEGEGKDGDVPEQVGVAVISAPARTGMAGDDSLTFQRLTVPLGSMEQERAERDRRDHGQ